MKGFVSAIGEDADFSRFTGLCIGKQTAGEAEKHHISAASIKGDTARSFCTFLAAVYSSSQISIVFLS